MTTKKVNVSLTPERVSLGPGETAEFVATVHNVSDVVEAYSIDVQGIDPAWSKLSVTSLSLFPGDKETVRIQVTPPVSSTAKAGSYPVSVRVISKRDPAIGTISSFILDLGKVSDYGLELLPKKAKGRKGSYQLAIANNGNTVSTYKLEAFDPEDMCEFRFKSDTAAVEPGTSKKTPLVVNPRKKPFTGASRSYSFSLKATPLEGEPKEVEGELECYPLLRKWAVAAIIIGVVALVGLIILLATSGGGGKPRLPINDSLRIGADKQQTYSFKADQTGTITAGFDTTSSNRFSLVLEGPDGVIRQHLDGQPPPDITYAVKAGDLHGKNRWVVTVANLSESNPATIAVHIEFSPQ